MFKKIKEKVKSFHNNENGAQVSTEVIILLSVGAAVAIGIGVFAKMRMDSMEDHIDSQLQEFQNGGGAASGE